MFNGERYTYKWVIVFFNAIVSGLTWGLLYAVGIIYSSWVRYFDAEAKFISFTGGLPTAFGCFGGPIFGVIINKIGFRRAGFLGGLVMTLGLILSSFAESVAVLSLTFGLMTGFGAGLINLSGCAAVNDYFLKNRAFAESICGSGLCIGTFVISLLQQRLVQEYKWQGAILVTGAICLHNSLASLFFVPSKDIQSHPLNLWKKRDKRKSNSEYKEKIAKEKELTELKTLRNNNNLPEFKQKMVESDKNDSSTENEGFLKRSRRLWQNNVFLLIISTDFSCWLAIFIPYVHLVERARLEGVDPYTAAWLSSTIGLAGIVGRPATGYICDKFRFNPFWCYCVVQMLVGLIMIGSSFSSHVYALFIFALLFGFLSNGYGLIKASAAVLLGPDKFVDAFSWMLFFEGIGICAGPFLAGWIYDITKSYNWSFRFSGVLLIASASMCFLKKFAEKAERSKIKNQEQARV